jgi:hypothetical protein
MRERYGLGDVKGGENVRGSNGIFTGDRVLSNLVLTILFATVLFLFWVPPVSGAGTSFAKFDEAGSCTFWLARHNAGNDNWTAGSAYPCSGGDHSVVAKVGRDGVGILCGDSGTNFAKCTTYEPEPIGEMYHSHYDNTAGRELVQSHSWVSSD